MTSVLLGILSTVIPLIIGVVSSPIAKLFQFLNADISKLPHTLQVIIVGIIGAVLGAIAQLTGIPMPSSLAGFDSATVSTLLNVGIPALIAALTHLINIKATPPPGKSP